VKNLCLDIVEFGGVLVEWVWGLKVGVMEV